jgi:hypothetical protein
MRVYRVMKSEDNSVYESRLNELFLNYRESCPVPEDSAVFMPQLWARIEAREASGNWFGSMAKALVTAAVAASLILGMLVSSMSQSTAFYNGTFVEALVKEHTASLEPLHLDRLSELEMEHQ